MQSRTILPRWSLGSPRGKAGVQRYGRKATSRIPPCHRSSRGVSTVTISTSKSRSPASPWRTQTRAGTPASGVSSILDSSRLHCSKAAKSVSTDQTSSGVKGIARETDRPVWDWTTDLTIGELSAPALAIYLPPAGPTWARPGPDRSTRKSTFRDSLGGGATLARPRSRSFHFLAMVLHEALQ